SDYFMSDSLFIQSGRYFSSKNEWFVPLYVNDKICSFMFVYVHDNLLRYGGGGEKPFAEDVDYTEKYFAIPENLKRSFLFPENHAGIGDCGFITAFDSLSHRYSLYPIITGFDEYCNLHYAPYEQYHSFRNYFISYHSGEYYNPEPKSKVAASDWYFFPNPFSDGLYLQVPVERLNAEGVTLNFYNLNGKQLFEENIETYSLYEYPVPMSVFPSEGIYLYTISDGDSIYTGKVVKEE
ncbi:MAG: T9SS type A sorting domain-containing protein, partial [Prolixibacteraceae bacterium]|nr:T9SS type A sorting domain-containing protein [Prolixibacteraceae bacterium]